MARVLGLSNPFGRLVRAIALLAMLAIATSCGGESLTSTKDLDSGPTPEAMPGKGVVVRPARGDWDTGYFQEALYSRALEDLGYEVLDHQELDPTSFYSAVTRGEVHFWANGWFPLHELFRDVFEEGAVVAGTVVSFGALQGYMVDKAGADRLNITSLEDFRRDDVKQAYDAGGNGRADLIGCQEGWGCKKVIGFHLDSLDLRGDIDEVTPQDYSSEIVAAAERLGDGGHVLFYTWTPNWTVNLLNPGQDVVWIEAIGAGDPEGHSPEELSIPGVAGCVNDPCSMGFPGNDLKVVANKGFLRDNPSAAKLFEVMTIPLDDISRQNNRMQQGENTQEDIDAHAEEWIALNSDLYDSWLAQARLASQ